MAIKLCNEVVDVVVHGIKETTKLFLNEKQPTFDASELLDMFEQVTQPLLFLSDNRKQQQYFRSLGTYIKPIEYSFGSRHRFEPVMNPGTGHVTQKATHNTWMYVPIKETLRVVLSQPGFINNVQTEGRNDEFIREFVDGESFNTHALFSDKSRLSIAIDLYADDIECANPLGSKATVHKICVWLFTIKNLPAYFNSAMQNIHLVALVHTADIKSYGYNVITKKISEDIKDLEIHGIEIEVNGVKQTVFASLGLVNADNLSRHGVFGFKEGFTAKKPCSTCFIDLSEIQETFRHSEFQLRTEQQYLRHLQQVESGQITSTDCGIVKSCELNNTTHWHVTRNCCGDLMHDFLEGVAPFETKLVLKELVEKGVLSLKEINTSIADFAIGHTDKTNRPSIIPDLKMTSHGLKQKAFQFGCLLRLLPLMIGHLVPVSDKHWTFLMELRHIGEILFCEKWTVSLAVSFEQQWAEHQLKFKELFPNENLIPKHHFLSHYGHFAVNTGPPVRSMTACKEIKGNFCKKSAHIVCNFKNICYTLANRQQFYASNALFTGSMFKDQVELFGDISNVLVDELPIAPKIHSQCHISADGRITSASKVIVRGQEYKQGNCIIISMGEKPTFGKICRILVSSLNYDSVYFFIVLHHTCYFDSHYFSYNVKNSNEFDLVSLRNILDFRPLDFYPTKNDRYFVPLRHKVF